MGETQTLNVASNALSGVLFPAATSQATVPRTPLHSPWLALVLVSVLLLPALGPFLTVLPAYNEAFCPPSSDTNSFPKQPLWASFWKPRTFLFALSVGLGLSFKVLSTVDDLWFMWLCDYLISLPRDFKNLEEGDNLCFVHCCISRVET